MEEEKNDQIQLILSSGVLESKNIDVEIDDVYIQGK